MPTDYRAMCAELLAALKSWSPYGGGPLESDEAETETCLINRARALLDRQEPQPPTAGEVVELVRRLKELAHATTKENWREFDMRVPAEPLRDADLVLARAADLLQRQHPQPVPVSERMPGADDCTAQGWCWVFYRGFATWTLEPPLGQDGKHTGYTHWLPANALPTPEVTNE